MSECVSGLTLTGVLVAYNAALIKVRLTAKYLDSHRGTTTKTLTRMYYVGLPETGEAL